MSIWRWTTRRVSSSATAIQLVEAARAFGVFDRDVARRIDGFVGGDQALRSA